MVKVFIVDDDLSILRILKLLFEELGYKIIGFAINGQIAIDEFKAFPEKPDVIIMDYRMPIKNGIEATIEILKIDPYSKIIFTTADIGVKEEALKAGAWGFLGKPFNFEELSKSINDASYEKASLNLISNEIG